MESNVATVEETEVRLEPDRAKERFLRWLTRHDPLPFFSAGCVLVGVWLIAGGLGTENWLRGKLWLHGITQLYEICLICGAAMLLRAGRHRSAVILGLLEGVFLLDVVFNTSVMPHLESFAWWSSAVWLGLALTKLAWLRKIFRLRLAAPLWALGVGSAALLAFLPQLLDDLRRSHSEMLHAGAFALLWICLAAVLRCHRHGSLLTCRLLPPASGDSTSDKTVRRIHRCGDALVLIWTLLVGGHFLAWMVVYGLELTALHLLAPALAILIGSPSRATVWLTTALISPVLVHDPGTTERVLACVFAAVLALRAFELQAPRLLVPTILGLGWALQGIPWLGGPGEWLVQLVVVAGWIAVALIFREPLSGALAALSLASRVGDMDLGRLGWGIATLALGFAALATGVWLQLRRSDEAPGPAPGSQTLDRSSS